ncbi:GntR family transcriptional regulator [Ferrovibrio sp.]|uniref:GntR family transcriptional regulator n=1 Tax=Ferrovibrio sp. TaxID=1917215 RepID=UPI0035AF20E0
MKITGSRKKTVTAKPATGGLTAARGEFVYQELRERIQKRSLRSGDRLREVELAEQLNVSRTPIREALKRLEADGLVAFTQPRGFAVAQLDRGRVMELYAMREILEGAAARFAALQASDLEIQYLNELIAEQASIKTPDEAARHNIQLHKAISATAHNVYLLKALNILQDALALLSTTTFSHPGRMPVAWDEHAEIVKWISQRKPEEAERAAREHIRTAGSTRIRMLFTKD